MAKQSSADIIAMMAGKSDRLKMFGSALHELTEDVRRRNVFPNPEQLRRMEEMINNLLPATTEYLEMLRQLKKIKP